MNGVNILSKDHFAAHQQIVSDYTLLLLFEKELSNATTKEEKRIITKIKEEMVLLLQRIIKAKTFLIEEIKADQDYLNILLNGT
jgi:hypothetical protein